MQKAWGRLKRFVSQSLYRKVLLSIIAVVALSLCIYAAVYLNTTQRQVIDNSHHEAGARLDATLRQAGKSTELLEVATHVLTTNTPLMEAAHNLDGQTAQALWELKTRTLKNLSNVSDVVPGLRFLRVYSSTTSGLEIWPTVYAMGHLHGTLPAARLEQEEIVWQIGTEDHARGASTPGEVYVSRFSNVRFGSARGVCVVETGMLAEDFFGEHYASPSDEQACFVLQNSALHHSAANGYAADLLDAYPSLAQQLEAHAADQRTGFQLEGPGEHVVAMEYLVPIDAWVCHVVSTARIGAVVRGTRQAAMLFVLGVAVLLTGVILLLLHYFLKRISALKKYMYAVQDEGAVLQPLDLGNDEVGQLNEVFNNTVRAVTQLTRIYLEDMEKLHHSEINLLKHQINWHFIYNTLTTMEMRAVVKGENDTADAMSAFGNMLRYTAEGDSALVPLRAEIRYLRDYITLINMQYEHGVELQVRVPNALMELRLPRMLLQPIVENAYTHGIQPAKRKGVVVLSAARVPDGAQLEVWDDGVGIPEATLDGINSGLAQALPEMDFEGEHIALLNTAGRIRAHFGAGYGLRLESDGHSYTRVILTLGETAAGEEGCDV